MHGAMEYQEKISQSLAVVEKAWGKLLHSQHVDDSLLRREIAVSWQKCLSRKVNPFSSQNTSIDKDFKEKKKRYDNLLTVAVPYLNELYTTVKGKDFIVMFALPDGLLLSVFGDRKMSTAAELLNVVPGGSCTEDILGTTAPGICLSQQVPVQVYQQEHYCQLWHEWCCSAAPIFDDTGNLLATLDVSNLSRERHPAYLLDLVKMTARAIQLEYNYRVLQGDFKRSCHYFNMVINTSSDALLFFNKDDTLTHLNKKAAALLGSDSKNCLGKTLQDIAKETTTRNSGSGNRWVTLQLNDTVHAREIDAYLSPINNEDAEPLGIICSLNERPGKNNNANSARYTFDDFVYCSKTTGKVVFNAKKAAATDINILIQGESGTGKEILAQAIHNQSARKNKPFVALNCAAIPLELIQSELFGYEEGAFTGAKRGGNQGKFELANHGTIFLDEIGDMPLETQVSLLRVLQEKYVVRVGGAQPIHLDVRIISATNKDLMAEVRKGAFRQDLFYRLAIIGLNIPPLRKRKEDLRVLLDHLIKKNQPRQLFSERIEFDPEVDSMLLDYDWPGNIRELENTVLFFLNRIDCNRVTCEDLPDYLTVTTSRPAPAGELKELEEQAIQNALTKSDNNISNAARLLGISRATMYRKLKKLKR